MLETIGDSIMKKYSNFIFLIILILFLGLFVDVLRNEMSRKKELKTIQNLEIKETEMDKGL